MKDNSNSRFLDGARSLYRFIWRNSYRRQFLTCLVALLTLPLTLAPIELQRRIIDDAVGQKHLDLLLWLVAIYAVVILAQQLTKYIYNVLCAKIAEHMMSKLRVQIVDNITEPESDTEDGALVSMLTGEVEPIGAFAGDAFAQLVTEGGVLLVIFGYMLYTEFWLASVAIIAFIPQAFATPFVQSRINEKAEQRIGEVRAVGDDALAINKGEHEKIKQARRRISNIFDIRLIINKLKYGLKAVLNLFDHFADLAVLGFGGFMVINGQTEVGVVVAFLSGLGQLRSPWRTLITYFRASSDAQLRFRLLKDHLPISVI